MTLDSWLVRASSQAAAQAAAQLHPPSKRPRLELALADGGARSPPGQRTPRPTQQPPPKFTPSMAKSTAREVWPPEYLYGRRDLLSWYSSRGFYDQAYPYALDCLPGSPHAVIGLETGEVHVVQCGSSELGLYDPAVGHATVLQPPSNFCSPIRDLAALDSRHIVSTSDSGVHMMDLAHNGAATLVGSALDVSALSVHADTQLVAFGTSSGSLGLVDLRERVPNVAKEWTNTHAVLAGPRAQRVRHGITTVVWCNDTYVATGSNANESVKFWDVRAASRKLPVHATAPRSCTRPRCGGEGGIISLVASRTAPGHSLWGLNRMGELLKLDPSSYAPQHRLHVPSLHLNTRYASLDIIPDSSANKPSTGHRPPQWPLIACGGKDRVTLVTEPSTAAQQQNVDACLASQLPTGEPTDVTKVKWHPYTNELVTISEDRTCRLWAIRSQRRIPFQFLPSDGSDAAHRPKKVDVSMTPIAY